MDIADTEMPLSKFAPVLGTIIGISMWLSPLKAVLRARHDRLMGSLNPYPFVLTVLNCFAWMVYAVQIKDYYIFVTNFPGFVLGLFYSISALSLISQGKTQADANVYFWLENMLIGGAIYFCFLSMYVGITLDETETAYGKRLVAYSGILCCIAYYAAPCTTISRVLKTKNSSSLNPPMIIANLSNATLWLVYGYSTLNDIFVYGPNLVGVVLSALQIVLIWSFRSTTL